MIYDVRHVTTYSYGSPVTFAQCALRVLPSSSGGQTVRSSVLRVDPEPASLREHESFFGDRIVLTQIDEPHETMRIEARSTIEVHRTVLAAEAGSEPWHVVRDQAFETASLAPRSPAHFLYPSPLAPLAEVVTEYARISFTPLRPVVASLVDLTARMWRDFKYNPDATLVSTPLVEAFENRHGVCQDFAHIMIAGLRGLGLPAAYVSGYIRTVSPLGQPRLTGGDASHAWVAVWCGSRQGWVGVDPTNNILEGNDHVVLGIGRDYADVAPIGGILQGAREQDIKVEVDVIPMD